MMRGFDTINRPVNFLKRELIFKYVYTGFTFLYLYTQSSFLQEVLQQEQLITPEIRKSA